MWVELDTGICEAPADYSGDCSRMMDTSGMSDKDKYTYGVTCGARWPCSAVSNSKAGLSFLSVDPYKIRNSLFLTQSMRAPPAASLNVIMQEDIQGSSAAAKYKGMEGQLASLKATFEKGLTELR